MRLDQYLSERGRVAEMAAALEIPPPLVSQWKTGARAVPIERCLPIERLTNGGVRRWDLRPKDWWQIWPELTLDPAAPKIPKAVRAKVA